MKSEEIEKMPILPILYDDVPSFMETPIARSKRELEGADAAVVGIPWEGYRVIRPGVVAPPLAKDAGPQSIFYRTGADKGPEFIRKYSMFYTLYESGGYFPEFDRNLRLLDKLKVVDVGDVEVVRGNFDETFAAGGRKLSEIVEAGVIPLILGGDHGVTHIGIRALSEHIKGNVGIIDIDSHIDLDDRRKFSAAWQFMGSFQLSKGNVKAKNLAQIGIRGLRNRILWREHADRLGVRFFTMRDVEERGIGDVTQEALEIATDGVEALYMTLDVDGVDPTFCPAQGYPETNGLTSREVLQVIRVAGKHGLSGFDVVELAPQYDDAVGTGAQFAARCLVEVLGTLCAKR